MNNSRLILVGGVLLLFAIAAFVPLMRAFSVGDLLNASNMSITITQNEANASMYLNTAGTSFDTQTLTSSDVNMTDLINQLGLDWCDSNSSFNCSNFSITFKISDFLNAINGTVEITSGSNITQLTNLSVSPEGILLIGNSGMGASVNVTLDLTKILPNMTTINSELAANQLNVTSDRNINFTKSGNTYTLSSDEGYGDLSNQTIPYIGSLISQNIGNITLHDLINKIIPTTTSATLNDFLNVANLNYNVTAVDLSNVSLEDGSYNVNVSISDGTNTYYKTVYLTLYGIQNADTGTADASGTYAPTNPNVYNYLNNITGFVNGTNVSVSLFDVFTGPALPSNMLSVIKYLNFTVSNDTTGSYTISFKVPVSAVTNPSNVFLYHFVNNDWTQLPTTYLGTDGSFDYYEATTPSFSMFMIMETTAPVATTTNSGAYGGRLVLPTPSAPTNNTVPPINATPSNPATPTRGLFAAILGAVIGAVGTPGGIAATVFVVLVIGALIAVFIINRGNPVKKKAKKEEKEDEEDE